MKSTQCRALFATHYHELNGLENSLDALSPHAMAVKEWQGEIVFMHEVIEGGADKSYGIHVARLPVYPKLFCHRAGAVLNSLTEENASLMSSNLDELPLFSNDLPQQYLPRLLIRRVDFLENGFCQIQ